MRVKPPEFMFCRGCHLPARFHAQMPRVGIHSLTPAHKKQVEKQPARAVRLHAWQVQAQATLIWAMEVSNVALFIAK